MDESVGTSSSGTGEAVSSVGGSLLAGIMVIGLYLRWEHVRNYGFLLSGDDGVVALMGLHMVSGTDFPLVFYGQHYMGTLDALVAGLFFALFGVSGVVYKATVLLFAAVTLTVAGWSAWRWLGWRRAVAAVGLMAFAPATIRWQMDQPNYGLLFLFGALMLGLTLRMLAKAEDGACPWPIGFWCLWAFVAGLGFWANSLLLALIAPVPALLWLRWGAPPRRVVWGALGCWLAGLLPLAIHNVVYPLATLRQFAGFFLDVSSRDAVQDLSPIGVLLRGLWHRIDPTVVGRNVLVAVGGFGFDDYPLVRGLGLAAAVGLLALVGVQAVEWFRCTGRQGWRQGLSSLDGAMRAWLLSAAGLVVLLGSTRTRYMALLTMIVPFLCVMRPQAVEWRRPQRLLAAGVALYVVFASLTVMVVRPMRTDNPVPALVRFLDAHALTRGYAGFELAYPVVVESHERIVVSPLAGPFVANRYPPFTHAVEAASSVFYVYPSGDPLAQALGDYLAGQALSFETADVEGHRVYWGFSRPVRPDEFLPEPLLNDYRRERGEAG